MSATSASHTSCRSEYVPPLEQGLVALQDLCLFVAVLMVPLTSASHLEFGSLIFVGASLGMSVCWAVQQLSFNRSGSPASGAELIICGAVALVVFQLIPLPSGLLHAISPFHAEYLPAWQGNVDNAVPLLEWNTLSVTPALTRSGLVLLIGYGLFFLTIHQRLRSQKDIERMVRLVAGSCIVMALLGLLQSMLQSNEFLGVFKVPNRTAAWPVKGAFTNQNHFAHFMALGLGPVVWCWLNTQKNQKSQWLSSRHHRPSTAERTRNNIILTSLAASVGLVAVAGILSFSRGGILALTFAGGFLARMLIKDKRKLIMYGLPVAAVIVGGLLVSDLTILTSKLNQVAQAGSVTDLSEGRFSLWKALFKAFPNFFACGSGLGSHAEVYSTWMDVNYGKRMSHAESGYFQIMIELGAAGLLLLSASIGLIVRWTWVACRQKNESSRRLAATVAAGVLMSLLHGLADFAWYKPGCMIVTLVLLACLCRCFQFSRESKTEHSAPRQPTRWAGVLSMIVVLVAIPTFRITKAEMPGRSRSEQLWATYRLHTIDSKAETLEERLVNLNEQIKILRECVTADPTYNRANARLAMLYFKRFTVQQSSIPDGLPVGEIRGTVLQTEFESPEEEAEWLQRAFGPSVKDLYLALLFSRRAIREQPMQDEAYRVLAEVGFLKGMQAAERKLLIEQGEILRPFDGAILNLAATDLAERGDLEAAGEKFGVAFKYSKQLRGEVIAAFGSVVSFSDFNRLVKPDGPGLRQLYAFYQATSATEKQQDLSAFYATNFESIQQEEVHKTMTFWDHSAEILKLAGDTQTSLDCLREAVNTTPHAYHQRRKLGLALLENNQPDEAITHLEWCLLRSPEDGPVKTAMARLTAKFADRPGAARL